MVTFNTQTGTAITTLFSNLGGHICKIIDLSAYFLIKYVTICKQWYGMEHACPHLLINLVYGLAILSLLDNLVKAIQNMNIICGLPEATGLMDVALSP
jgi:N-acetyl-gamma-glutamyl-phosphate reductase